MNTSDLNNYRIYSRLNESPPTLAWKNYTKNSEIKPDGNSTLFVDYGEYGEADDLFADLKKWLAENHYDVVIDSNDAYQEILRISTSMTIFLLSNCLVIRFLKNHVDQRLLDHLSIHDLELESIASVEHITECFLVGKTKIMVKCTTGIIDDIELLPKTFMYFRRNGRIIAKALIGYYAGEMNDCAPTIEMFEVNSQYRGRGIGKKVHSSVEQWVRNHDFSRIRIEDTRSRGFWKKMGYEIDLDEGVKYFDY